MSNVLLLVVLVAPTQSTRVFDIRMTDRGFVHELLSPDTQTEALGSGLPAGIKPGTFLKEANLRFESKAQPAVRHSGKPGQHGGKGYYKATVDLDTPYWPVNRLHQSVEAWQMVGASMRLKLELQIDIGEFDHGFLRLVNIRPIHRIVNRIVERIALSAEQMFIEQYVKEYREKRAAMHRAALEAARPRVKPDEP